MGSASQRIKFLVFADYAYTALPSALDALEVQGEEIVGLTAALEARDEVIKQHIAEIERLCGVAGLLRIDLEASLAEVDQLRARGADRDAEIIRLRAGPEWSAFEAELKRRTAVVSENKEKMWQETVELARAARDRNDAEIERLTERLDSLRSGDRASV